MEMMISVRRGRDIKPFVGVLFVSEGVGLIETSGVVYFRRSPEFNFRHDVQHPFRERVVASQRVQNWLLNYPVFGSASVRNSRHGTLTFSKLRSANATLPTPQGSAVRKQTA